MRIIIILLIAITPFNVFSQLTWAQDAAEIIYANCTVCHNDNGIAPFSLMDYESVLEYGETMIGAVESDYMPPWTADDEYQSYAHSRRLSNIEKNILLSWLNDGMTQGNLADAPPPPVYNNAGFIQATPDIELEMEPYTSNASATLDDYVCISLPTGLTESRKLKAFEVIPGNPSILHHCLVYIDDSGTYPTDLGGVCVGPNNDEGLIGGYTPGAVPTVFPSNGEDINMGITVPAGSNIVLAMHYPHGSAGEIDQTKIKLFFYEDDVEIREVSTYPILQNWNFTIPANSQQDVSASWNQIPEDISILSVFPHMHLLGEYIRSYAVTPDDETIPLVKINHWDFEWQEFYFFEEIQHIPSGSVLYANGVYNNTSSNPHNPNEPPITVTAGLNTTDEMFLVYFHFLEYEDGDEEINLTELTSLPTGLTEIRVKDNDHISVYPNPSVGQVNFGFSLTERMKSSLFVYSSTGELVEKLLERQMVNSGTETVTWDTSELPNGVYYYSLMLNGENFSGKILVE